MSTKYTSVHREQAALDVKIAKYRGAMRINAIDAARQLVKRHDPRGMICHWSLGLPTLQQGQHARRYGLQIKRLRGGAGRPRLTALCVSHASRWEELTISSSRSVASVLDASQNTLRRILQTDKGGTMKNAILGLSTAFALAIPSSSMAAFVSGPVTYAFSSIYSGTSQALTYDADGSPYSALEVLLFCIDHATQPPFVNAADPVPVAQFDTQAGASAIKGASGAAGEAAIYWLLDQYYISHYKNGTVEQRRALQYALWEIGNDYNGTATSIDIAQGASRPSLENVIDYGGTDQSAFVNAYTTLYAAMRTSLPTLRSTYRSNVYTMDLFRNRDTRYQHMAALIEQAPPNTVPLAGPSITGTPLVGSSVTGNYTYADNNADVENPGGTTYRFVTSSNPSITNSGQGTVVASDSTGGASQAASYTVQPSDLNQYLFFCVTPAAQTGATPGLEACSVSAGPVANVVSTATPVPTLGQVALMALMSMLGLFGINHLRRRESGR